MQPNIFKEKVILYAFLVVKIVLSFVLVNNVYELHRDEFLHLDQANHLAAGYISVPPFTALVSLLIKALGNSECWVRFFPALFGALTILYAWKMVEQLGGNLFAKCLVAIACICSVYTRLNTLYQPNSFDVLSWTAVCYYLLRYFNDQQPAALYWMAVYAGLGVLNKYNIAFLFIGLLPALLLTPARRIFTNKHCWLALLLATVIVLPNLIWQVQHHFPVIGHMKELKRTQLVHVNRADFFKEQLLFFVNAFYVLLAGFAAFILYKPFRQHRWVLYTYVFTMAAFVFFSAKAYYALGLYPVILAAGSVYLSVLVQRTVYRSLLLVFTIGTFAVVTRVMMPLFTPAQIAANPRFKQLGLTRWNDGTVHEIPQDFGDMLGWKELAALVDSIYAQVPDKQHLLILCDNYGEAGAINYYSRFGNIGAVTFSADYINWFHLEKPILYKIRVREYPAVEKATADSLSYGSMQKIGEVNNRYSLEYGTAVYYLTAPKVNVNTEIQDAIIAEQQH